MPLSLNKLTALAVGKTNKPGYYGNGGGLWLPIAKSGSKRSPVVSRLVRGGAAS
jgi:hypothetical protein